jgi:hypothetical protein
MTVHGSVRGPMGATYVPLCLGFDVVIGAYELIRSM